MDLCNHVTAALFMSDLTQRNTHEHLFRPMPIIDDKRPDVKSESDIIADGASFCLCFLQLVCMGANMSGARLALPYRHRLPNREKLGNRWLSSPPGIRQHPSGSHTGSQVTKGCQIATLRVSAHFSGRVDIRLATLLFEVQAPATCFEEGAELLQGWFCPICLFLDQLRV